MRWLGCSRAQIMQEELALLSPRAANKGFALLPLRPSIARARGFTPRPPPAAAEAAPVELLLLEAVSVLRRATLRAPAREPALLSLRRTSRKRTPHQRV